MLPISLLPLFVLAQAAPLPPLEARPLTFTPTPAPPPEPAPGTEAYRVVRDARERALRIQCYSDAAIGIILEQEDRAKAQRPDPAGWSAIVREVAEAAYAEPLDLDRLARAIAERERAQAEQQTRFTEDRLTILHLLPPADQVLFARSLSVLKPYPGPIQRTCGN